MDHKTLTPGVKRQIEGKWMAIIPINYCQSLQFDVRTSSDITISLNKNS